MVDIIVDSMVDIIVDIFTESAENLCHQDNGPVKEVRDSGMSRQPVM